MTPWHPVYLALSASELISQWEPGNNVRRLVFYSRAKVRARTFLSSFLFLALSPSHSQAGIAQLSEKILQCVISTPRRELFIRN